MFVENLFTLAIDDRKEVLTHLQGSEMDNAVNIGVCGEDLVKGSFVSDIDIVVGRSSARQQFDATDDLL